ncbi:hypothetical protein L2E82_52832 [Cichorium intybus]|nr:hypothetical protein L2E82_53454 [Cichorium intybus]KAI3672326.1 hypothetical protein L2E82_52832 [Cichorium intybus]
MHLGKEAKLFKSVARSGSLTETGTRHGKARSTSFSPEVRNVEVPLPSPASSVRHGYLPPSATIDSIPKMEEVLPSVEVKFLVSASSFLLEGGPHYFGKEGPTSVIPGKRIRSWT